MTSELPKGKAMWMRSFYGFSPEEDGYVGVGREAARDRMLREMNDGDLVLIYGSGTAETKKAERSCVLGFLQVDARAIRDVDKSSPEALKRKTDKGWEERWTYGIPVRRAWRAAELRTIRDIAFKTYRPEAGQALGVWGAAMEPDESAEALKIRVTEVNVYGEPPVSDGLVGEAFEQVFTPSRAFQGSAGTRTSVYEEWRDVPLSGRVRGRWTRADRAAQGHRESLCRDEDRRVQRHRCALRPAQSRVSPSGAWKMGNQDACIISGQKIRRRCRADIQGE